MAVKCHDTGVWHGVLPQKRSTENGRIPGCSFILSVDTTPQFLGIEWHICGAITRFWPKSISHLVASAVVGGGGGGGAGDAHLTAAATRFTSPAHGSWLWRTVVPSTRHEFAHLGPHDMHSSVQLGLPT